MFGRILAVLMVSALASFFVALISSLLAPASVAEAATIVCQALLLAFLAAFAAFLLGELLAETIGRRRSRPLSPAVSGRPRPRPGLAGLRRRA